MNAAYIINLVYIIVCSLTLSLAFILLCIFVIYYRQCFNFSTLLTGNTILAVLIYALSSIASGVSMISEYQGTFGDLNIFCALRAYFENVSLAGVHHSLLLQSLEKYCKIKRVKIFDTRYRQVTLVIAQWALDFIFFLPILLSDNLPKLPFANICFMTLSKIYLAFIIVTFVFYVTDISLVVTYRHLVRFVRQVSITTDGRQKFRMNRYLTMVRRIVLLNTGMAVIGSPSFVLMIILIFRMDFISQEIFTPALIQINFSFILMLILLTWMAPNLRRSVIELFNTTRILLARSNTRVIPATDTARY